MGWTLWLWVWVVAGDLILTRKSQGDVYRVEKRGRTELLVGNLTLPTSAAAHRASNSLYVSSEGGIYRYQLQNTSTTPGTLIYQGGNPTSLVVDVWGNLYFADDVQNLIAVIYTGNTNVTVLYENDPVIQRPSALALDDFNEFLFWVNGANGGRFGSIHIALKNPLNTGIGHLTSWLFENETFGLALSHNSIYISTASGVFQSNKHAPKYWERITQMLSAPRVLAIAQEKVYLTDLTTGTLYAFKEGESAADMSLVEWAPEGVTHISVISSAKALLLLGLLVSA